MTPDYPSSLSCSFPPLDMKDSDHHHHHHHHQSQLSVFISGHQANSITTSNFLPSYTSLLQDQRGSSSTTTGLFIASSSIQTVSGSQGIHLQAPEIVGGRYISSDDRELTHRNGIGNNISIPNFKIMKLNGADSITGGSSGESIDILSNKGKQNKDSSYCCSKMMFSGRSNDEISTSSATRMCGDCNTTTTPLWRTGPLGPKSLCNACGIRRRKARRAEEEAVAATTDKKARPYHRNRVFGYRKLGNSTPHKSKVTIHGDSALQEPPIFKNLGIGWVDDIDRRSGFRPRAFPEDETEAAIMLMELSYGFTHTD